MEKVIAAVLISAVAIGVMMPGRPAPQSSAVTVALSEPVPGPAPGGKASEVVLTRDSSGHFYADALVNGRAMRFLVDTGATRVALTRKDAEALGIHSDPNDFTATGKSAGGPIALHPVVLDSLAIGGHAARNVEAVVVDKHLHISLLGQSWLRRIGSVTMEADRMILR